ncbi:MAG TPA: hypothetical protein VKI44_11615 [Acetobacteraceae bacterium]|nr:hypothetical protein [Acetobacteraceae bacterium]
MRAKRGEIAVTIDCRSNPTVTLVLPVARFMKVLATLPPPTASYATFPLDLIQRLIDVCQLTVQQGADGMRLAMHAAWSIINHAEHGTALRQRLDAMLASDGRAHLTWRWGLSGLGLAVSDRYVDVEHSPPAAMKTDPRLGANHPVT